MTEITVPIEVKAKPRLCVMSYTYRNKYASADGKVRHEWIGAEVFVGGTSEDMHAAMLRVEGQLHPDCEITNVLLTVVKESTLAELARPR